MTFREKLAQEHPELISPDYAGGCAGCPYYYGYEPYHSDSCDSDEEVCRACWDREMPLPPEDYATDAPQEIPQAVRKLVEARIRRLTKEVKALEAERDALCEWLNGVGT